MLHASSMVKKFSLIDSVREYQRLKVLANRCGLSYLDFQKLQSQHNSICELLEVHKLKPYEVADWLRDIHGIDITAKHIRKALKILNEEKSV